MAQPKMCQSCALPLKNESDYGTEKDGTRSEKFCSYCYANGEYLQPNITFDEMLQIGLKGIAENKEMNGAMKFMIKKMYPKTLKNLERWKE